MNPRMAALDRHPLSMTGRMKEQTDSLLYQNGSRFIRGKLDGELCAF